MVSTSVCGDGAKGRRGECRGGQVLELGAWRCAPESEAPRRLRATCPARGKTRTASFRYARMRAARSSGTESKTKSFFTPRPFPYPL